MEGIANGDEAVPEGRGKPGDDPVAPGTEKAPSLSGPPVRTAATVLSIPQTGTDAGSPIPGGAPSPETAGISSLPTPPPSSAPQPASQAIAPRLPPPPAAQVAPVVVGLGLGTEAQGWVEVVLEPAELGRVEIRLERDGAKASLHVQAERPETLALLQRDGAELNRALSQAGLAPEGGLSMSFSLSGGDSGSARRDGPPAPAFASTPTGTDTPATARLAAHGLLDIAI